VNINDTKFLMTFDSVIVKGSSLNLARPLLNRKLNNSLNTDFDETTIVDENSQTYMTVYVENDFEADCLKNDSLYKIVVENYLKNLIDEYYTINSGSELDAIINKN